MAHTRRLARHVTVQKTEGTGVNRRPVGEPRTFPKGATPPEEWAKLITNLSAWETVEVDEDAFTEPTPPTPPAPTRTSRRRSGSKPADQMTPAAAEGVTGDGAAPPADTSGDDAAGGSSTDSGGDGAGAEPPAGNASTEEWATFGRTVGVTVPDGAGREDIKALLTERGLLDS